MYSTPSIPTIMINHKHPELLFDDIGYLFFTLRFLCDWLKYPSFCIRSNHLVNKLSLQKFSILSNCALSVNDSIRQYNIWFLFAKCTFSNKHQYKSFFSLVVNSLEHLILESRLDNIDLKIFVLSI